MLNETKTAVIVTLGCRLNQADTALLGSRLNKLGFRLESLQKNKTAPDLIVVNSCAVTAVAVKKTRHAVKALRTKYPDAFIVLTGCAASVDHGEFNDCSDFDLLLNNEEKKELNHILAPYLAKDCIRKNTPEQKTCKCMPEQYPENRIFKENEQASFPFHTRGILKIQEGCENFCTYCIVPYARGPERSRDIQETLEDCKQMVDSGIKEIVLSGVNICNYRCNGLNLVGLLEKILTDISGDFRIRLSSTEPGPVLPDLIRCIKNANGRVCHFLHLPLQNGSDKTLKAMGRHCFTQEYQEYIQLAREMIPGIHIGSDLIVGFPGESRKNFEDSCEFIEKISFSNLHVFPYSPRSGTPAALMPGRVTGQELDDRLRIMDELKNKMSSRYMQMIEGSTELLLPEKKMADGYWEGWTGNYVRCRVKKNADLSGRLIPVRFVRMTEKGIYEAVIPDEIL